MPRISAYGIWGLWLTQKKNWGRATKDEDLREALNWYLSSQQAKVQTWKENLGLTMSSAGNRRRNSKGWFSLSRAGGNLFCEMCRGKQLIYIIRHLYNCHWNRIPKPSGHILQSRELMCASSSTASLEQRWAPSVPILAEGAAEKNKDRCWEKTHGLTGDISVLWCILTKPNKSSAVTITVIFFHQKCSGYFL